MRIAGRQPLAAAVMRGAGVCRAWSRQRDAPHVFQNSKAGGHDPPALIDETMIVDRAQAYILQAPFLSMPSFIASAAAKVGTGLLTVL